MKPWSYGICIYNVTAFYRLRRFLLSFVKSRQELPGADKVVNQVEERGYIHDDRNGERLITLNLLLFALNILSMNEDKFIFRAWLIDTHTFVYICLYNAISVCLFTVLTAFKCPCAVCCLIIDIAVILLEESKITTTITKIKTMTSVYCIKLKV